LPFGLIQPPTKLQVRTDTGAIKVGHIYPFRTSFIVLKYSKIRF